MIGVPELDAKVTDDPGENSSAQGASEDSRSDE
jgi:hypothetical protein